MALASPAASLARAFLSPQPARTAAPARLAALRSVWQVVLLFALVLGGKYLGWFSPTEAAAVGAIGAVALAAVSSQLDRATPLPGVSETALTTGMIFMILIGAGIFNAFIESTRLTNGVIGLIEQLIWNRWTVLAAIIALYLVLGALMGELSMILLTVVLVFQLIVALGCEPIWFGVVLIIVCEIAMILPPVGINLFVIQGVAGVSQATVVRGIARSRPSTASGYCCCAHFRGWRPGCRRP